MRKQLISFLISLLLSYTSQAQVGQSEGVVSYRRTTYWPKVYARMTYLSQEQKDRAANTWKNDSDFKEKMTLVFSPVASLYSHESETGESEDGRWTWRNKELFLYRNFEQEKQTDVEEMLGKTYVVADSLKLPVWRIGNEIREIAGHLCTNATTTDPIKNQTIMAWFAQDIPVPAGPERYCGLPGLILELDINQGDVVIEATALVFKPVAATLKPHTVKKAKTISTEAYDTLLKTYIADQIKAQQNPYWEIRY